MSTFHVRHYLAPRFWPTWLLLGFMRSSVYLPYRYQLGLGKYLGRLFLCIHAKRRRIARINIGLCFPELNPSEQRQMLRQSFESAGIAIFEAALAWWGKSTFLQTLHETENLHYLQDAIASGQPVLLLSGHMSCTDIGGRLLTLHTPFQAMYKKAKNALFEAIMLANREQHYEAMIDRKNAKKMIQNLKKGITTWYAPDQDFVGEQIIFAPFMGIQTSTLMATARISKVCNAIVIPFFPIRLPDNSGYKLTFAKPLENFPSSDGIRDASTINAAIEAGVRLAPEQYLWMHKRFRTRPLGEPPLY